MKPKFKVGDKVKVTLELTVDEVVTGHPTPYYVFDKLNGTHDNCWMPRIKTFDKEAKLIPAKKKVAKKKVKK